MSSNFLRVASHVPVMLMSGISIVPSRRISSFRGILDIIRAGFSMEKTLQVIEEMSRLGIIKAYAIGGGIAATYYIEPVLTYDLGIFFLPIKEALDELAPIYEYLHGRGYSDQAEALMIEGFPVQFIPAYNDLVREAVADAAILRYRDVEAKVVKAEYLVAIALQTNRPKDRERVLRLLEEATLDRDLLTRILERHGLTDKLKKLEGGPCEN